MLFKRFQTLLIMIFLFLIITNTGLKSENIKIPGNPTLLSRYMDFYYNLPTRDFIYHLNDLLLFSEAPSNSLIKNGIRKKVLDIIQMEHRIEKLIKKRFQYDKNMFTINISRRKGYRNGIKLMNYLGLYMEETTKGLKIEADSSSGIVDYHSFINLKIEALQKQVNKTMRIFYRHITSNVPMEFDMDFLRSISGLPLSRENFLEYMVKNKKFSLLLAVLYRLSEREIEFITGLNTKKIQNPWRYIFMDKNFLIGIFNLSTALRVRNGRIILPGGQDTSGFWSGLAQVNYSTDPLMFLKSIATSMDGKLNYLFSNSFFVPGEKLKALFFNYNLNKTKKILSMVDLTKNEKLSPTRFPRLREQGYFNLIYGLEERDGKIYFPGGIKEWLKIFHRKKVLKKAKSLNSEPELFYLFLRSLLEEKKIKKKDTPVRKFLTIYSKFLNRPGLMFENIPDILYSEYDRFNVLTDYFDKIDIKRWETIIKMINWAKKLQTLGISERADFSAIYQSIFEVLSFVSKNHPNGNNFDRILTELIKIPLDKKTFISDLFKWLNAELKIPLRESYIDKRFEEFMYRGLQNRIIEIEDSEYEFQLKNATKKSIDQIISSQEVIPLSSVFRFEQLFKRLIKALKKDRKRAYNEIVTLFQSIPHPEISDEAPGFIKRRVMTYSRRSLNKNLRKLSSLIKKSGVKVKLEKIRDKFRDLYIFPHLKNYLVTIAYALNAKSERLRMFINPNLVKLHDFEAENGHTPWNYSGRPESSLTIKTIPGFRLKGGLSRLNLLFSSVWKDQMLAGNIIYDPQLIQAVISNLSELYPFKELRYFPEYISLSIEYGLESINNAKKNEKIKLILLERIGRVLRGYSYRKLFDFLKGKDKKTLLFYSEYYKIGRSILDSDECMKAFSEGEKLKKFLQLPLSAEINREKNRFGNIYYHVLGTLRPSWKEPYPLEQGMLFKSGYYLGEVFREFKMRLAYLATKKKYPPALFGHLIFNYMISSLPRFYQQNYDKDIYTTYFIFNIMNNANFKKVFKKYKRNGFVRLR